MFLILLVVYSAWVCPFEFAFLKYMPNALFLVDNIIDGFFAIDIVLTFFVAYLDHKSYLLVDNPKRIAARLACFFVMKASLQFLSSLCIPSCSKGYPHELHLQVLIHMVPI